MQLDVMGICTTATVLARSAADGELNGTRDDDEITDLRGAATEKIAGAWARAARHAHLEEFVKYVETTWRVR